MSVEPNSPSQPARILRDRIFWSVLLVLVILAGAALRFTGMNWDANQHLHPDERFLTMVATGISPVQSLGEYFDTANSSLNPDNRGFGYYVYGTLPLFIVRYLAEWSGQTGYDQIHLVGRYASAAFDLMTVLLVFIAALRLYRKLPLAVLASGFYALAVLPIQLSHYFTTDSFLGFFGLLTLLPALWIATSRPPVVETAQVTAGAQVFVEPQHSNGATGSDDEQSEAGDGLLKSLLHHWGSVVPFALFGVALGLAMSSKVSAFLLGITLPIAAYIYLTRVPKADQDHWFAIILRNLVIAVIVAFIVFRIFQPYAFTGPGFLGMIPSKAWTSDIKELAAQSTGDVDFPPALQWSRRPITFAWQNLIQWGLGLPLGLLALAGLLWMGWRIVKGEWKQHSVLWVWTIFYSAWWGINFSRTMRYQLLVYPTLAIMAAWAVITLWEKPVSTRRATWTRVLAAVVGGGVLLATAAYAYAFTHIYDRPMTRVAASEWIYQNVPGPINLQIDTAEGSYQQPLGFRYGYEITSGEPWVVAFQPGQEALLTEVRFAHVADYQNLPGMKMLVVTVTDDPDSANELAAAVYSDGFTTQNDSRGNEARLSFQMPLVVKPEQTYYLVVRPEQGDNTQLNLSGPVSLVLLAGDGEVQLPLPEPVTALREEDGSYTVSFTPLRDGTIRQVDLPHVVDWEARPAEKSLVVSISDLPPGAKEPGAQAVIHSHFFAESDRRGQSYSVTFDPPMPVKAGSPYYLTLTKDQSEGKLAVYGSKTAIESTWDDPLPLPMEGFSPFDYNDGLYRTDLNFEMYWEDNADKLDRFVSILNQADYIFITSNRQWGTTVRVPERYPLTTAYYRDLIGCPETVETITCYAGAQPGLYQGRLGFDLVKVFQSNPSLGPVELNTQYAEEAFTVYDHPKVLIFQKSAAYNAENVREKLASVDLSTVVHVTPRKTKSSPANLMLPDDLLQIQRQGGTWSQLFDTTALYNAYPGLGLVLWYLVITLLGWVIYPVVRFALRGLPDRGYPFSKLVGLLLLAYFSWLAGSAGIPVTRITISVVAFILLLLGLALAYVQREELALEWREKRAYFLSVEAVALAFFAVDLFIRLGNPDLWHPYKGGEKPMDFSYFNAVIKSTIFPPYDPWFAGGYINYYYFGFVVAGIPVKWLGIVPAIGYNLVLPTFFSMLALGAFSVGWNLLKGREKVPAEIEDAPPVTSYLRQHKTALIAGVAAAVALLILGNLGTVRMIWHGIMRLVAPGGSLDGSNIFQKLGWTLQGLGSFLSGQQLPYNTGDWYWIPSRVYPKTEITEFPFFTFLYADPHAHLFALPLTVLALAWALSIVMGKWRWGDGRGRYAWLHFAISIFTGGLVIGSLRPVNTWDLPTYLVLGVVAILYTALRHADLFMGGFYEWSPGLRKAATLAGSILLLVGLSFMLFQPYANWYRQGYNSIKLWEGDTSPFWSYITHWGVFLFFIVSWLVWETREWMASTPASSLKKLARYQPLIMGLLALLAALAIGLTFMGVSIAWLALIVAAWAAVLLLRPGLPDVKRVVLFMIGSALTLTLAVEVIVLEGDVDRMNTVFKFYLQAWTLLSLSAAAALIWLWPAVQNWGRNQRVGWETVAALLVFGALLFPLMGGAAKIRDRMSAAAPHTLDGMAYMPYSTYADFDYDMKLIQDYMAIRWLQENVQGSPVIVEANTPEYRWGSRYTIYTGLPGVVGWNWHQRQQRTSIPGEWVFKRVEEVGAFYFTEDRQTTEDFLKKYQVKYIILGQLERAEYRGPGLDKFALWEGDLWKQVFQLDETTIYEVLP